MSSFCMIVGVLNFINYSFLGPPGFPASLLVPSVFVLPPLGFLMYYLTNRSHPFSRLLQALLMLAVGGPVLYANGVGSFFGYWFLIVGMILLYKYQFLNKGFLWKFLCFAGWTMFWIYLAAEKSLDGGYVLTVNYLLFILMVLACLYALFEEEISDLIAANTTKDAELAQKEAEIARLVPLSVLGERVAHVAHSFKNNLSMIGSARLQLEQGGDPLKASQKLDEFSQSMHERIDNILMVSQAGATREPEVFDAARVLAGLNQVYLTEPAFLNRAAIELEANQPTPVLAVRWDFLLMAENILKNALEALTAKGGHGTIRITLKDRLLTLANDGGAMELCSDCRESCLDCPRYGKPGRTTKASGSGHGLTQVFAACRRYGWTLRIRTQGEWTFFEIGLTATTSGSRGEPG